MNPINTVCLIEDEPIMHELFRDYFESEFKDKQIVGMCMNAQEGIALCIEKRPDLVLLDIRMPEVNGLEALRLLKLKVPDMKVVIYSGTVSEESVRLAIDGKADGFVCKADGMNSIASAISALEGRGRFYSPSVAKLIIADEN